MMLLTVIGRLLLLSYKLRNNIVKGYCGTTCLRLVIPQPLWQCYDAISRQ